jgi:hypothetical protein
MSVWFITGASRGFGLELTRQALARGNPVAATARHRPRRDHRGDPGRRQRTAGPAARRHRPQIMMLVSAVREALNGVATVVLRREPVISADETKALQPVGIRQPCRCQSLRPMRGVPILGGLRRSKEWPVMQSALRSVRGRRRGP